MENMVWVYDILQKCVNTVIFMLDTVVKRMKTIPTKRHMDIDGA